MPTPSRLPAYCSNGAARPQHNFVRQRRQAPTQLGLSRRCQAATPLPDSVRTCLPKSPDLCPDDPSPAQSTGRRLRVSLTSVLDPDDDGDDVEGPSCKQVSFTSALKPLTSWHR